MLPVEIQHIVGKFIKTDKTTLVLVDSTERLLCIWRNWNIVLKKTCVNLCKLVFGNGTGLIGFQ